MKERSAPSGRRKIEGMGREGKVEKRTLFDEETDDSVGSEDEVPSV